jgi:hypothetical protein
MAANTTNLKGFAALLNVEPSYVTKLKQQGRLVFADAAQRKVLIAESRELIEQTAGNRSDVAQRNQAKREESAPATASRVANKGGADKKGKKAAESAAPDSQKEAIKQAQIAKAMAESRRVQALADKEEMERDRLAGNLIPREEVDAAFKFIGAAVRAQADVYADQTTPLVAPITDLNEVHEILAQSRKDELAALGQVIEQQRAELQKAAA